MELMLAVVIAAAQAAPSPAPTGAGVAAGAVAVIEGQVAKVDLSKNQLTIKVAGPRELIVVVDDASTRMSRLGQAQRLHDIRAGEKVVVSCEAAGGGRCQARMIKVGTWKRPGPEPREGSE